MYLFAGESIIAEATSEFPRLTTHRLWFEVHSGSFKIAKAIMLTDLCYSSVMHEANTMCLGYAALTAVASIVAAALSQRDSITILVGVA
jgi:hypothetical protein